MAAIDDVSLDIRPIMRQVSIKVTLTHMTQIAWRIWLANRLLRLAKIISPMEIEFTQRELTCQTKTN